jgi:tRNA nucleotidyltransferase (CCA-adding enzyme)
MKLSTAEEQLFAFLQTVVEAKSPDTILRVAGGWVRDILLGHPSHDIDIAVNNMSGLAFVKLVHEFMDENSIDHGQLSIIEARPEQSKHLETAIINLMGFSIDFANLRKETYADSRIPTIEVGTAFEDSHRRDLTINSMFYNLSTGEIEDLTGKGLNDISAKICRTPIDSIQTFLDDPLRILRAIRFACKYEFDLSPEIILAAKEASVQNAFRTKLSKERIWAELVGVSEEGGSWKRGILTIDPVRGSRLLQTLGLRDLLLKPGKLESWDDEQNNPHHDLSIWEHTLEALSFFCESFEAPENFEDYAVRILAVVLHDLGKCCPDHRQMTAQGFTTYHEHEIASAKLAREVLISLNAPLSVMARVERLVRQHMRLHGLPENASDAALRRFIRDLGEDWEISVDIAIADAYGKISAHGNVQIREKYESFRVRIHALILGQGSIVCNRPINGKELMRALGLRPGPIVGKMFKALDEILLEDPKMDKDSAIEFCRSLV